jgi:hypothetical protein
MTRLVLNRDILSKIGPLDQSLEICDDSGHTLGFFKPLTDQEHYHDLQPLISREEIERRKQIKEGRSLKEILADLERGQ